MVEPLKLPGSHVGNIPEEHFDTYLKAGLQMPISNFALNLTHIAAITTASNPARYFESFFASTLTADQIVKTGEAMSRAHRSSHVGVIFDSSPETDSEGSSRRIDSERLQRGWKISKAHTIRSLLSYIQRSRFSLPDDPTQIITPESKRLICDFFSDPHNIPRIEEIATLTACAQQVLMQDKETITLKKSTWMVFMKTLIH